MSHNALSLKMWHQDEQLWFLSLERLEKSQVNSETTES